MRQPGHGGHHDTRQQLHGRDVAMVEGVGHRGQHLKQAKGAAIVAKRGDENGAGSQPAAAGEVHARIGFGVVTKKNFPGAQTFGGKAGVGLQVDAEVGSSAASARAANDLTPVAKRDGGAGGASERLSALGNDVDSRLKFQFVGVNLEFHSGSFGTGALGVRNAGGAQMMPSGMERD